MARVDFRVWRLPGSGASDRSRVVSVGVFDGVHVGHQAVLERLTARATECGAAPAVLTFDPHPDAVFPPGSPPGVLTPEPYRGELLRGLGVAELVTLPLTVDVVGDPAGYLGRLLTGELHAAEVIVGASFSLGPRVDARRLVEVGERRGVPVTVVPTVTDEQGVAVSAGAVRRALAAGDVERVIALLGRPYRVAGVVVRGHQRGGSALGFPTANVASPPGTAVPRDGVYAGVLRSTASDGGDRRWPAAISVGMNATFGDRERSVEAYALDRDDLDLYGRRAAVEFAAYLRDMVAFDGVDALIAQMHRDVEAVRRVVR